MSLTEVGCSVLLEKPPGLGTCRGSTWGGGIDYRVKTELTTKFGDTSRRKRRMKLSGPTSKVL